MYISKHWSVPEWDCLRRDKNDYAWNNGDGKLCTNNEQTAQLFKILDTVRQWRIDAGLPNNWIINTTNAGYKSGYRTPTINAEVGGVGDSTHTTGCAADIHISGQNDNAYSLAETILAAADAWGLRDKVAIGLYGDWIHVDTRGYAARW